MAKILNRRRKRCYPRSIFLLTEADPRPRLHNLPTRRTMATQAQPAKTPKTAVLDKVQAQYPFFDLLSSSAQLTLIARQRAADAPPGAPAVAPVAPTAPPAAFGLGPFVVPANIRVNNPSEDIFAGNRTTQSEPSIAVSGKNVVVGYNDSTLAPNYTGYSNSANGGAVFTDRGGLPGNQSGDNVL